jgi:hypothetical protein
MGRLAGMLSLAGTLVMCQTADCLLLMLLGFDVQAPHSSLVAAVLRQRLSPDGQAVICCAVRDQASSRAHPGAQRCILFSWLAHASNC